MQRCILLKCTKTHDQICIWIFEYSHVLFAPRAGFTSTFPPRAEFGGVIKRWSDLNSHSQATLLMFSPPSVLLLYFYNVVICIFVLLCCFCITTCIFCIFVLSTSDQILTHILRQLCLSSFPIKPFFLTPVWALHTDHASICTKI